MSRCKIKQCCVLWCVCSLACRPQSCLPGYPPPEQQQTPQCRVFVCLFPPLPPMPCLWPACLPFITSPRPAYQSTNTFDNTFDHTFDNTFDNTFDHTFDHTFDNTFDRPLPHLFCVASLPPLSAPSVSNSDWKSGDLAEGRGEAQEATSSRVTVLTQS